MGKLEKRAKQNPKLEQRVLKDGRISLRLVYYHGRKQTPVFDEHGNQEYYITGKMAGRPKFKVQHKRTNEYLGLYLWQHPKSTIERQHNKENLELAEKIRHEKEQEFKESLTGYRMKPDNSSINFLDFFQTYIDEYKKKDIRMVQIALNRFRDFLDSSKKYSIYREYIRPQQLNADMMMDFVEYLKGHSRGEGAKSIYQRFKKVVKYAVEHGMMASNPCNGVSIVVDDNVLRKDILSFSEIEQLINTHYACENPNVRNAFIFCLYTGLRFCDVKDLTYGNIDYSNKMLRFEQHKTEGHSRRSYVTLPLTDGLLALVGKPVTDRPDAEPVFNLPTYESCSKSVKRWVSRAGINKHISWHCARHSFAVNVLNNGANIKTVGSLLGHSGLRHTEKYTRAVDELKKDAINSLPPLKL